VSADTTSVLGDRDGVLIAQNVLKIRLSLGHGQALDSVGNLAAVLEVNTDVSSASLGS
jgi:hypothetical protein